MRSRPNSDGLQDRSAAASSIDSRNLPSESSQCQVAGVQSSPALDAPLPGVTVVVCTRNRPDDLTASLDAISRLNPGPNEILVVDNSDGNGVHVVQDKDENLKYEAGCFEAVLNVPRATLLPYSHLIL